MSKDSKKNEHKRVSTPSKNNKKKDGKFRSKNIKHDPNAESARAVFGLKATDGSQNNDT